MSRYAKPTVEFLNTASVAIQAQMLHDKNINLVTDATDQSSPRTSGSAYDLDE